MLNIALKLIVSKLLKCPKKVNTLDSNTIKERKNHHLRFMQILKVFCYQKIMESKIQICLKRTNIKKVLLTIMATN